MDASGLRHWRQARELSQDQLATMLEVPVNTLARWERGEVAIRHPRILALALHALDLSLSVSAMQQDGRKRDAEERRRQEPRGRACQDE